MKNKIEIDPFRIIYKSILFLRILEKQDIGKVAKMFAAYSNQVIPSEIVDKFAMTGLANEDFLTSDFLNRYGLKNLIQFIEQ